MGRRGGAGPRGRDNGVSSGRDGRCGREAILSSPPPALMDFMRRTAHLTRELERPAWATAPWRILLARRPLHRFALPSIRLVVLMTGLFSSGDLVHAQLVAGTYTNDFSAQPPVTQWSTASIPGASSEVTDVGGLNSTVQAMAASTINTALTADAG